MISRILTGYLRFRSQALMFALFSIGACMLLVDIAPALLSMAMGLTLLITILQPNLLSNIRQLSKQRHYLILMLPFVIFALSLLIHGATEYGMNRLRIKSAFLVLPLAAIGFYILTARQIRTLLTLYTALLGLASLALLIHMISVPAEGVSVWKGQALPTPISHIRFSLMLAIALVTIVELERSKFIFRWQGELWIRRALGVVILVTMHVLAVRSGLLALYTVALVAAGWRMLAKKDLRMLVILAMALLAPVVAYHTVPSFRAKIGYMLWDIRHFRHANPTAEAKDGPRLVSMMAGWDVFIVHPFAGAGIGNVQAELQELYDTKYAGRILPRTIVHNQYLFILAATGVLGFALFLTSILWPLILSVRHRSGWFMATQAILLISFAVEATLETQLGAALYIFFVTLGTAFVKSVRLEQQSNKA